MNYAQDFLTHKDLNDVCAVVHGELPEVCTEHATYFYGNGEVIVCPVNSDESFSLFVDRYGDRYFLVNG